MRRATIFLALCLALAGCGAKPPTPVVPSPTGVESSPEPTAIVPPEVPPGFDPSTVPTANEDGRATRIVRDGYYVAGIDIAAGFYRSMGLRADAPLCSWSLRDRRDLNLEHGAAGGDAIMLASGISRHPDEPQRVALVDGQVLNTHGCDVWVYYGP